MAEALSNFVRFKRTFRTTKLLFDGLNPDRLMFSGNSLSSKKLYLLYDWNFEHYNVITKLKGALAKRHICNECDALYDKTLKCDRRMF